MRSYICSSVGAEVSRAFSAPTREQPPQLALVGAQLGVARLHRREQLDHRLADVALQVAVAAPVVPASTSGIGCPVATARISIRFETPGFSSGRSAPHGPSR